MLGKLLKYEFKCVGRTMLPLYGVLMAIAVVLKVMFNSAFDTLDNMSSSAFIYEMFFGLTVLTFVILIVAVSVVSFVLVVKRFYSNLLGDEGYLMNTLPVTASQQLWCKLISGGVWSIVSLLISGLAIFLVFITGDAFTEISEGIRELMTHWYQIEPEIRSGCVSIGALFLFIMIITPFYNLIIIYLSTAIGHIANKHKIGFSVLAWIGITWAIGIITNMTMMPFVNSFTHVAVELEPVMVLQTYINVLIVSTIETLIVFAAAFIGTKYIIEKKLNLE